MRNFRYIVPIIIALLAFNWSHGAEKRIGESIVVEESKEIRKNGEWFLYVEDAYAASVETGKPIMANFTGSDWCGWCIRLKNEVFKTQTFIDWAAKNVVLLELDYPRKKQLPEELQAQNSSLQQAFKVSGYPTLWVFNLNFDEETKQFGIAALGKTGYVAGGADAWIKQTNKILSQGQK